VGFMRRLVFLITVALLGSALSGCVVRPLWWGHHGYHDGERNGGYEPQHRDEVRRDSRH
jgi:hypothetical protein